jgi:hypothetical protein
VWLPALGVIAACSVLTAPLGARSAHQWPADRLRRVFALLLVVLASYMLWKGLARGIGTLVSAPALLAFVFLCTTRHYCHAHLPLQPMRVHL